MAYTNSIPNATDLPSNSRPQIKGNFEAIYTVNGVNHIQFNDSSGNQGKHKYVSFPVQTASPPTPPFVSGECGMYSFLNPNTSQNELYISKLNQATDTQIPFTASNLSVTSAPAEDTAGWSYLPSGLLIKWGTATTSGSALNEKVYYDTTVPFGAVFSVTMTPRFLGDNDILALVYGSTRTYFEVYTSKISKRNSPRSVPLYYFAIGRP